MSTEFIGFLAVVGIMTVTFSAIAVGFYKLNKFRKTVRPDHVVKVKFGNDYYIATVDSRPGLEMLTVRPINSRRKINTSIYHIYPL